MTPPKSRKTAKPSVGPVTVLFDYGPTDYAWTDIKAVPTNFKPPPRPKKREH